MFFSYFQEYMTIVRKDKMQDFFSNPVNAKPIPLMVDSYSSVGKYK